jgi:NADPH:quinone reductase-like Zn-dependent oxidoreductase
MIAVRIHEHGDVDALKLEEVPEPRPRDGELLIDIKAAGINHLDTWVRRGVPGYRFPLPITPGCDGAGVVVAVGAGVDDFSVGDRVAVAPGYSCGRCEACLSGRDHYCRRYGIYGESTDGTMCERFALPLSNALRLPDSLSFAGAAAMPLVFLTAWEMLIVKGAGRAGDTVLIHAAGSGVGSAAIQIARYHAMRIIATAGSQAKLDQARALGADEVINYRDQDFVAEVRRLTGKRGVDIALDHIGGPTLAGSLRCLVAGGRVVTCGATGGAEFTADLKPIFFKKLAIVGSTMGSRGTLPMILRLAEQGVFKPVVDRVMPMSQVAEAHRLIAERVPFGKIILEPAK